MKIAVFNGSNKKGCTWNIKNLFVKHLGERHEITEFFMPKDLPEFCTGCAVCVTKGVTHCPHDEYVAPIRKAIEKADLLIFTSPVYVFHITGALKNLFDHLFVYWMAHRPEAVMMNKKQAVIITDCLGMGNGSTAKTIKHSMDYWGVARRHHLGFALMGSIFWNEVSEKRKEKFERACEILAKKVVKKNKNVHPRFKIKMLFRVFTIAQKIILKKFSTDSLDYKHWKEKGWLDNKKPWKNKR